jgi:hypothetical protein
MFLVDLYNRNIYHIDSTSQITHSSITKREPTGVEYEIFPSKNYCGSSYVFMECQKNRKYGHLKKTLITASCEKFHRLP